MVYTPKEDGGPAQFGGGGSASQSQSCSIAHMSPRRAVLRHVSEQMSHPRTGLGYASGREIASVVRGAETVGGVDAVAVWSSYGTRRH